MSGQHALVTGASEGIGRAFARQLAKQGWLVTGVARNGERLAELAQELGPGHRMLTADLSQDAGIDLISKQLAGGSYRLLVNNAGFGLAADFREAPIERLDNMIALNITALTKIAHAFLRTAKRGDALVNISSMVSFMPLPGLAVYSASKAFVTSFSEALWAEEKKRGVYVVGICPGSTLTEFHQRAAISTLPQLPKLFNESADDVVETALKALKARKAPIVVSGAVNRLGSLLARFSPRPPLLRTLALTRL